MISSEAELRALCERQMQLELKQPAAGHYRHAISMVELGAGTKELISNCGLSRGEAELLLRMHGGHQPLSQRVSTEGSEIHLNQ